MQMISKTIKVDRLGQETNIYAIGDTHLGNINFKKNKLQRDIDIIKNDPNGYWIGLGDYTDAIDYKDKRFDPKSIDPELLPYLDTLVQRQAHILFDKMLYPIKDKCLGLVRGNHDDKVRLNHGYDYIDLYCKEWGVPNLEDAGMIQIRRECSTIVSSYVLFITHGNVAGRKNGSKANRLEDMFGQFECDIYIIGHGHKKLVVRSSVISPSFRTKVFNLTEKTKVGFMTGAYLSGYEKDNKSYVEKAGFPPTDLGCVMVQLYEERARKKENGRTPRGDNRTDFEKVIKVIL